MALTRDDLLHFMDAELGLDVSTLEDSALLFSTGMIDSFMLITLMTYIEAQGGFRIAPGDVTLDNLDSIERIMGFSQRMAGG
ncbi:MAG TPA: phosphopantetheine-binding protein [Byssovorax sp.]|jgi:acyl carrier protein